MMKAKDVLLWPENVVADTLELDDPNDNILLDDQLAASIARSERPPLLRIWQHSAPDGLVVSRRDVATQAGQWAREQLAVEGCPVFVRSTGGTAVPHGRGMLNLSLLFPRVAHPGATTDAYYRLLCQPLLDWLNELGGRGEIGDLPGSYCDGHYNVLLGGRKLVGTAQTWKGGLAGISTHKPGYIVAHACISVYIEVPRAIANINRFYELSHQSFRALPETAVSLHEAWETVHSQEREEVMAVAKRSLLESCQQFILKMNEAKQSGVQL